VLTLTSFVLLIKCVQWLLFKLLIHVLIHVLTGLVSFGLRGEGRRIPWMNYLHRHMLKRCISRALTPHVICPPSTAYEPRG
jgi:hypothetical protein